jgi:uncharacterized protein
MAKKTRTDSVSKTITTRINDGGWSNLLTNLGVLGKDRRKSMGIDRVVMSKADCENLYQADDLSARIVDRPCKDMFREGFKIMIDGGPDGLDEVILKEWDKQKIDDKNCDSVTWSWIYGGAGIVVGANDGQTMDKPLNKNSIKSIDYWVPLDRYLLTAEAGSVSKDIRSPYFLKPEFYNLTSVTNTQSGANSKGMTKIHASRIIPFYGVKMLPALEAYYGYWGDSIYSRLYDKLQDFNTAHGSVATIIQDFTQLIYKLTNLNQILRAKDGQSMIMQRLQLISQCASMINAVVIQDNETFERKSQSVAGLKDLLVEVNNRLVAATDIPHTVLLGQSPSGLGATGESEKRDYFDFIRDKQDKCLRAQVMTEIELMMLNKSGPTKGKVYPFTIEFESLWHMSDKEMAEVRNIVAQTDEKYINLGVLDETEVRGSRFGSGVYSIETELDKSVEAELMAAKEEEPAQQTPEQGAGDVEE